MARLPRLVVPNQAHHVILRGHGGQPVFADLQDRAAYRAALRDAATAEQVAVHAWALLDAEVQLLATPRTAPALGRLVQAVGRRYVSASNRRHGRSGTLWDGRFRCAVVEPGATRLAVLRLIDGQSVEPEWTSAAARTGGPRTASIADLPEVWALGNTPFEREAAWREMLAQGLPTEDAGRLRQAALHGWVSGSAAFAAAVQETAGRPAAPRARGRPRLQRA